MLNFMRRFASTWFGKILGGLLLIGLAGFGISNVLLDLGSTTLAKVGNEEITTTQFQRAYQQQLNQFAQQTGQMPTGPQAVQLGLPTTVLSKLASDAAVNQLAVSYGIGVSDAQLAKMVREAPSIANTLGIFAGTAVPKTAGGLLNRYRNDTRSVEYFTLNSTSLPDIGTPTEDDLKKYLTDHQADFRTKETRTVDVLALTQDALATQPQYQPTEDEVKAEYDRTKDSLTKVEKRDIQQVPLTDPSKEAFFKPGTSFLDDVKAAGLTATAFGLQAKTEVVDASVAEAAFGLAKEGDFTIIPGIGAKRVIG